jgi:exosortase
VVRRARLKQRGSLAVEPPTKMNVSARHLLFASLVFASLVPLLPTLGALTTLVLFDGRYVLIAAVPGISAGLVYLYRKAIFDASRFSRHAKPIACVVVVAELAAVIAQHLSPDGQVQGLAVVVLSILFVWIAGFIGIYGERAFVASLFPLCLLVLMIPLPSSILDRAVFGLQKASAEVVFLLFRLLEIPFLRQEFRFSLPGVDIEVARECSGIRSSLSLVIASSVLGYVFLQSAWKRFWLTVLAIPIVIVKNAIRIVTIASLGSYVDPSIFDSTFHRAAGLPFSILGMGMLGSVLFILRRPMRRKNQEPAG